MTTLTIRRHAGVALLPMLAAACGAPDPAPAPPAPPAAAGAPVLDTVITATYDAAGTARPVQEATLSTRLMGAVTAVLVHEGDRVRTGQLLARIDARGLDAQREQAMAQLRAAEAARHDAERQAQRFRALYADSAAPKVQLDVAETGLARAEAMVRAAEAATREVGSMASYAELRAPFAGTIVRRHVDPGSFAAPGMPLLAIEDASRLRLTVTVPPAQAAALRAGATVAATIEGTPVQAVIEGVVRQPGAPLLTVNALVPNPAGTHVSGGAARIALPMGTRRALLVPQASVVREGDLAGVHVATPQGAELRWVRLGVIVGDRVEVRAGLEGGDRVLAAAGER